MHACIHACACHVEARALADLLKFVKHVAVVEPIAGSTTLDEPTAQETPRPKEKVAEPGGESVEKLQPASPQAQAGGQSVEKHQPTSLQEVGAEESPAKDRNGIPLCFLSSPESKVLSSPEKENIAIPPCFLSSPESKENSADEPPAPDPNDWQFLSPRPVKSPKKRPSASGDNSADCVKVYVCHPKREPKGSYIQIVVDGKKKHVITISEHESKQHKEIITHLAEDLRKGKRVAANVVKKDILADFQE